MPEQQRQSPRLNKIALARLLTCIAALPGDIYTATQPLSHFIRIAHPAFLLVYATGLILAVAGWLLFILMTEGIQTLGVRRFPQHAAAHKQRRPSFKSL